MVRLSVALFLAVGSLLGVSPVQGQILPPLPDDQYRIDLYEGPVLGSTRVIGLGGAFAAIAEQSVGIPFNAASVANRAHHSDTRFDWDMTLDWLSPGIFQGSDFDFDTNGIQASTDMIAFVLGGQIQYGSMGIGMFARGQRLWFEDPKDPAKRFRADMGSLQFTGGYGLFKHQLIVGVGVRLGHFEVIEKGDGGGRFKAPSAATDIGFLYRPRNLPFRLALSLCSPAESRTEIENSTTLGFKMPEKGVAIPWEFRIGGALRIGGPEFNPMPSFPTGLPVIPPAPRLPGLRGATPPQDPEKGKGKKEKGGVYVTLVAELVAVGRVEDAVGTDGFLLQKQEWSGQEITWSPRIGAEMEIIPKWVRIRGGFYWEPTRFEDEEGRLHGTCGFEIRLFDVNFLGNYTLKISGAADFACRYSNVSLAIGFWH